MLWRLASLLVLALGVVLTEQAVVAEGTGTNAPLEIVSHDSEVTVLGRDAMDEVRVSRRGSAPGALLVQSIDDSGRRRTWLNAPYGQYTKLNVSLGDDRDGFQAETPLPGMQVAVSAGRGNDVIISAHVDRVYAGPGNDVIAGSGGGGPGSDLFVDGHGSDVMRGGPGPDALYGGRGADLLDGGPGPGRDNCRGGAPDGPDLPPAKRDRALHCELIAGVP